MASKVFLQFMTVCGSSFFFLRKGFFGDCEQLKSFNGGLYFRDDTNQNNFVFRSDCYSIDKGFFYDDVYYIDPENTNIPIRCSPIFKPIPKNNLLDSKNNFLNLV